MSKIFFILPPPLFFEKYLPSPSILRFLLVRSLDSDPKK
jgi:hypothetical protein